MTRKTARAIVATTLCLSGSAAWANAAGEAADGHWSVKPTFMPALTGIADPRAHMINDIGLVAVPRFAIGLSGANLFHDGDALTFTIAPPLRAESVSATLMPAIARDWTTANIIMGEKHASLLPMAREFDVETGYRFSMGAWSAQANVAYAVDPDHLRGGNAMLTLFSLTRMF
jgi:hypothetical protein